MMVCGRVGLWTNLGGTAKVFRPKHRKMLGTFFIKEREVVALSADWWRLGRKKDVMEQQDHKNRIDFLGGFMMKKVFAILCTVLTIALMLTGCGGQKAENHYTIGIGQFGPHGSWITAGRAFCWA